VNYGFGPSIACLLIYFGELKAKFELWEEVVANSGRGFQRGFDFSPPHFATS
jgi:hypothetical protein